MSNSSIKILDRKPGKKDAVFQNEFTLRPKFTMLEGISGQESRALTPLSGHNVIPRSLKDVPTNILLISSISTHLGSMADGSFDTLTLKLLDNDSDLAIQQWGLDSVFSSVDLNTVQWTSGTLMFADGQSYSISSGNTGNISALSYIFFDPDVSATVLQVSTNFLDAVGNNRILIGVAKDVVSGNCTFQIFGGSGGIELNPTTYTDEQAQDAVGTILADTGDIDFTYTDSTPEIVASVKTEVLDAGTYSPTRSAEVNMDSNVTVAQCQYMRVRDTVTVSGRFTADPTLPATATSFEITLPVASNIGAVEDLAGVAFCGSVASMGAEITGSVANNTAVFTWVSSDVASQSWSFTFTYQVI